MATTRHTAPFLSNRAASRTKFFFSKLHKSRNSSAIRLKCSRYDLFERNAVLKGVSRTDFSRVLTSALNEKKNKKNKKKARREGREGSRRVGKRKTSYKKKKKKAEKGREREKEKERKRGPITPTKEHATLRYPPPAKCTHGTEACSSLETNDSACYKLLIRSLHFNSHRTASLSLYKVLRTNSFASRARLPDGYAVRRSNRVRG